MTYTDSEYRQGLFASFDKYLIDRKFEQLRGNNSDTRVQVFRLYFELLMMGFPVNKKSLITAFLKSVRI